ncbi:hypothetical protein [Longimicrobium sp.]|uniref:YncE family protein n=1 Tax=Longimicrobium sp. TaxID=2029185 RepID=UPI002E3689E4|nr:hypothetical protein [Longimicrobium sp.]HEX6042030.1 hypothetical protein [Longimicrobium sp.]
MNLIRGRAAVLAALVATTLLAACDNSGNPFRPEPGENGGPGGETPAATADSVAPTVSIMLPNATTRTIAVGDSLFVQTRVQDAGVLDSVVIEGFSVRGDPNLGTARRVDRWDTKTVALFGAGRAVKDTTLNRFLYATSDTLSEGDVFVVVTAVDTTGNAAADTFQVAIGGPKVSVLQEVPGDEPKGGSQLTLKVSAADPRDLLNSVTISGSGAFTFQRVLSFTPARAALDTTLVIPIPQAAVGTLNVTSSAVSGSNQTGTSVPLAITVRPAEQDVTAPRVTFQTTIPQRVEQTDTFSVAVSGADETRVDSVGVTVLAIRRRGTLADTLRVYVGRGAVTGGTFRFGYEALGLSTVDTSTVDLEVTAWAKDPAGNCGAATTPNSPQQLPCAGGPQGSRLSAGPGRLVQVYVARGRTLDRPNGTDVIADLVADNNFVYLSNFTRNRVEVLPLGGSAYGTPVRVGSAPWGLAVGRFGDSLYVANSGGTNISVIPLGGAVLQEAENRRLFPRNERLFGVVFSPTGEVTTVTLHDYSDRPQFLGQASNGLLVYSTRPTPSAEDGTVRIFDPAKQRSEIFIGYVDRHTPGRAVVVNADSAFHVAPDLLMVCPRRRFGDTTDPSCYTDDIYSVADSMTRLRAAPANASGGRYDVRVDIGAFIDEVGLSDTTFVATSTDRRFVAVGEGVRENARIPMFEALGDSLVLRGDIRDLISNSAERVIGLGINRDGSLGVARGGQAYFFTSTLRLQGTMESGAPTGGVAMHPQNQNYPTSQTNRLAFVSGIENGRPYIDVLDAFYFTPVRRIFLRDPVVGALVVAPRAASDPANVNLRLYALTSTGVLGITITNQDLLP